MAAVYVSDKCKGDIMNYIADALAIDDRAEFFGRRSDIYPPKYRAIRIGSSRLIQRLEEGDGDLAIRFLQQFHVEDSKWVKFKIADNAERARIAEEGIREYECHLPEVAAVAAGPERRHLAASEELFLCWSEGRHRPRFLYEHLELQYKTDLAIVSQRLSKHLPAVAIILEDKPGTYALKIDIGDGGGNRSTFLLLAAITGRPQEDPRAGNDNGITTRFFLAQNVQVKGGAAAPLEKREIAEIVLKFGQSERADNFFDAQAGIQTIQMDYAGELVDDYCTYIKLESTEGSLVFETDNAAKRCKTGYTLDFLSTDLWSQSIGVIDTLKAGALSPSLSAVTQQLPLSSEEMSALELISGANARERFPLFLEGRPGSGKSTLLQYAFAEFWSDYVDIKAEFGDEFVLDVPLYITYSDELLKRAHNFSKHIVEAKSATNGWSSERVRIEEFGRCFRQFDSLLLSFIPSNDRKLHFRPEMRVDYAKFKKLWSEQFRHGQLGKLSASDCWYAIRTYIKGLPPGDPDNDWFDVADYEDLRSHQQAIEIAQFRFIYEKVWLRWYKPLCDDHKAWDNQDLVIAASNIIAGLPHPPEHAAIVCDEAQDYTSREIEFLLLLSAFSRRKFTNKERMLKDVPFLFAGDPLQTLNPSGLDWAQLKALVFDSLQDVYGIKDSVDYEVHICHKLLETNYRATEKLAYFTNTLLLLRALLTQGGDDTLKAQLSWFSQPHDQRAMVHKADQAIVQLLVNDRPERSAPDVIILPCLEGEKEDWIKNDPILSSIPEENAVFLTAAEAKGAEWETVFLYKFGDYLVVEQPELIRNIRLIATEARPGDLRPIRIQALHQLSRVYVGASRAQKKLLIIDSESGIREFWNYVQPDLINRSERLKNYFSGRVEGWDYALVPMLDTFRHHDATEVARGLLNSARSERSTQLARAAMGVFGEKTAGYYASAAVLHEIDENWKEAADAYLAAAKLSEERTGDIQEFIDAGFACLWSGHLLQEYAAREKDYRVSNAQGYVELARWYSSATNFSADKASEFFTTAANLIKEVSENPVSRYRLKNDKSQVLDWAIEKVPNIILEWLSANTGREQTLPLIHSLAEVFDAVEMPPNIQMARLFARAWKAEKAPGKRTIWCQRTIRVVDSLLFDQIEAAWKIDSLFMEIDAERPYPFCLPALAEQGRYSEIFKQFKENEEGQGKALSATQATVVFDAALNSKDHKAIQTIIRNSQLTNRALRPRRVIAALRAIDNVSARHEVFLSELDHLLHTGEFGEVLSIWRDNRLYNDIELTDLELRASTKGEADEVDQMVVSFIAFSDAFADTPPPHTREIRSAYVKYLQGRLDERNHRYRRELIARVGSPLVLGAIIERDGGLVESRKFYEKVIAESQRWNATREQVRGAVIRWISCQFKEEKKPELHSLNDRVVTEPIRRYFDAGLGGGDEFRVLRGEATKSGRFPTVSDCLIGGSRFTQKMQASKDKDLVIEIPIAQAINLEKIQLGDVGVEVKWIPNRSFLRLIVAGDIVEVSPSAKKVTSDDVRIIQSGAEWLVDEWAIAIRVSADRKRIDLGERDGRESKYRYIL